MLFKTGDRHNPFGLCLFFILFSWSPTPPIYFGMMWTIKGKGIDKMKIDHSKAIQTAKMLQDINSKYQYLGARIKQMSDQMDQLKNEMSVKATKPIKLFDHLADSLQAEVGDFVQPIFQGKDQLPAKIILFKQKHWSELRDLMNHWPEWGATFELLYYYVISCDAPDHDLYKSFLEYLRTNLGTGAPCYQLIAGYVAWLKVTKDYTVY